MFPGAGFLPKGRAGSRERVILLPLPVPAKGNTPSRSLRYTVLFIALLAGFITPFDGSAVNIALPSISAEFHMDAVSLSWISTAYLLAAAIFLVPFGRIADIYGRKRVFLYGIAVFTIASLLVTMVPTTALLILARTLQGFGGALIYGTSIAFLTSVFPPHERGKALGIYVTADFVGLMAGPAHRLFRLAEHLLCQHPPRDHRVSPHCHETRWRMGGVRGGVL